MRKNQNKYSKIALVILSILLVISVGAGIYYYRYAYKSAYESAYQIGLDTGIDKNLNFFNDYIIATNNINIADSFIGIAQRNLDVGNWYTQTGEYYYESAIDYYDLGKEQTLKAKELLNKAKVKLQNIQNNAPNSFFQEEVSNRIDQIDILLVVSNNLYSLMDYAYLQLYEINYGSEAKAKEYYDKYNDLIPTFNSNMKRLSDISNEIDLAWDQDWYPTFQESEAY